MAYTDDELRDASIRAGLSFDYLKRLATAADYDSSDPEWNAITAKQLTVVFDHHMAKCFTGPDPIGALRRMGFTEVAAAIEEMRQAA